LGQGIDAGQGSAGRSSTPPHSTYLDRSQLKGNDEKNVLELFIEVVQSRICNQYLRKPSGKTAMLKIELQPWELSKLKLSAFGGWFSPPISHHSIQLIIVV
jgi:hypothetical protein